MERRKTPGMRKPLFGIRGVEIGPGVENACKRAIAFIVAVTILALIVSSLPISASLRRAAVAIGVTCFLVGCGVVLLLWELSFVRHRSLLRRAQGGGEGIRAEERHRRE
jgi:hypothetical protein